VYIKLLALLVMEPVVLVTATLAHMAMVAVVVMHFSAV
jgi:hypothetical protein